MAKRRCPVARERAVHLLRRRIRVLRRHVVRARAEDPDGIHDLRVASRRLRVALKETSQVFPKRQTAQCAARIRDITRLLGVARELDVCIALLEKEREALQGAPRQAATHAVRYMRRLRKKTSPQVAEAVALIESSALKESFKQVFENASSPKTCLLDRAVKSITRQRDRLRAAYRDWRRGHTEAELHNIRIGLKKLRYACEVYDEVYGKPLSAYLKRLKEMQEALGAWNDYRVLRDRIAESAANSPPRGDAANGVSELLSRIARLLEDSRERIDEMAREFFHPGKDDALLQVFAAPRIRCENCTHKPPV